jgi:UrcA family protein
MSLMNRKRRAGGQPLIGLTAAPLTTVLLCTAAFMATGAIAAAQTEESIHLSYVTADVTEAEGAKRLYRRIKRAARMVCHAPDLREQPAWEAYQRCYDRAVDDAVAKVGASALTALHRSKTQRNAAG